jgi:hypothetical protein
MLHHVTRSIAESVIFVADECCPAHQYQYNQLPIPNTPLTKPSLHLPSIPELISLSSTLRCTMTLGTTECARKRPLLTSHASARSIANEYANGAWRKCRSARRAPLRESTYACVHFGAYEGCKAIWVEGVEMVLSAGWCDSFDQQCPVRGCHEPF